MAQALGLDPKAKVVTRIFGDKGTDGSATAWKTETEDEKEKVYHTTVSNQENTIFFLDNSTDNKRIVLGVGFHVTEPGVNHIYDINVATWDPEYYSKYLTASKKQFNLSDPYINYYGS